MRWAEWHRKVALGYLLGHGAVLTWLHEREGEEGQGRGRESISRKFCAGGERGRDTQGEKPGREAAAPLGPLFQAPPVRSCSRLLEELSLLFLRVWLSPRGARRGALTSVFPRKPPRPPWALSPLS